MPIFYQIDTTQGIIFATAKDIITHNDIKETLKTLTEDPDFDPLFHQLLDLREVTSFQSNYSQTFERVEMERERIRNIKSNDSNNLIKEAIVVPNQVLFGQARQYASLIATEKVEVKIFENYNEALTWLLKP